MRRYKYGAIKFLHSLGPLFEESLRMRTCEYCALSAAATAAALPTPYIPLYEGTTFGSTVTGWVADFVAQTARPNPGSYVAGGIVDLTLGGVANKYPLAGTVITESSNWIKSTTTFNDVSSQLNNAVQNRK
jgi:filamentous hemagglutinin